MSMSLNKNTMNKAFERSIWDQKGPVAESGMPCPNGDDVRAFVLNLLSDTDYKFLARKPFNECTNALRKGEEEDPYEQLLKLQAEEGNQEKGKREDEEKVLVKIEDGSGGLVMGTDDSRFLDPVQSHKESKPVAEDVDRHRARMKIFSIIAACLKEHHGHLVKSVVRGDVYSLVRAVQNLTQGHTKRAHLKALRRMTTLRTSKDVQWADVAKEFIRINNCLASNKKTIPQLVVDALFETMEGDPHFELVLQSLREEHDAEGVTIEKAMSVLGRRACAPRTVPLPTVSGAQLQGLTAQVPDSTRLCYSFRDNGVCNYKNCRFEPCCSNTSKASRTKCFHCHGSHHYKKCAELAKIFRAETGSLNAKVAQKVDEAKGEEKGEE